MTYLYSIVPSSSVYHQLRQYPKSLDDFEILNSGVGRQPWKYCWLKRWNDCFMRRMVGSMGFFFVLRCKDRANIWECQIISTLKFLYIYCFYIKKRDKVKMDWRRWASIARLSIRKMCCLNGSRKLLTQKIMQIRIVGVRMDFPHEVRFSAGIGPAHFLAETTRPLGPRLSAFSPALKPAS